MNKLPYLLLFVFLWACAPAPTGKVGGDPRADYPQRQNTLPPQALRYEDARYDSRVQTVQLYPDDGSAESQLLPAVAPLGRSSALWLQFDWLADDYEAFYAEIIHCDRDWQPSRLSPMEYLPDFHEFPLTDYAFSFNTLSLPYVHYRFQLPEVLKSGNYVLVVYPEEEDERPILSRRFMIYEEVIPVQAGLSLAPGTLERRQYQQIEARIHYNSLPDVLDPASQFTLYARQNQRWDMLKALRASAVWEARQEIEYRPLDLQNAFPGGNEFRFFDLRSLRARGQNVRRIQLDSTVARADLVVDEPRNTNAYAHRPDQNGLFVISNFEQPDAELSAEYAETFFYLKMPEQTGPLYLAGAFNNYERNESSRMRYEESFGGYIGKALLKQGFYNYAYVNAEGEMPDTEGRFSETENSYELFLYYREPVGRYDQLLSYRRFSSRRP